MPLFINSKYTSTTPLTAGENTATLSVRNIRNMLETFFGGGGTKCVSSFLQKVLLGFFTCKLLETRFGYPCSVSQQQSFFSVLKPLPFEAVHSKSHDETSTDHAREVDSCDYVNLFIRRSHHVGLVVRFISGTEVTPTYFGHISEQHPA